MTHRTEPHDQATQSPQDPFTPLTGEVRPGPSKDISTLADVPVRVSVELGRTRLPLLELLQLAPGSIIELTTQAGEPVDILVNGTPIAKGETTIMDERFGVRLTGITTQGAPQP